MSYDGAAARADLIRSDIPFASSYFLALAAQPFWKQRCHVTPPAGLFPSKPTLMHSSTGGEEERCAFCPKNPTKLEATLVVGLPKASLEGMPCAGGTSHPHEDVLHPRQGPQPADFQ